MGGAVAGSSVAELDRSFAKLLLRNLDWLVTVEPHLHRVAALTNLHTIPATAVHLTAEVGRWIAASVASPFIIGPDVESPQWVQGIAGAGE